MVTLTLDLLTLKLVCESHLRSGTFLPNLGTLCLLVLELLATYPTNGQTKSTLTARSLRAGHNKYSRTDGRLHYSPVRNSMVLQFVTVTSDLVANRIRLRRATNLLRFCYDLYTLISYRKVRVQNM